jgi:drug/metabolite transporter (DMT)-like permease
MSANTGTAKCAKVPYALLGLLLALDVAVFMLQKTASLRASGHGVSFFASLGLQIWTWLALALGPVQLVIWTRILGRMDISLAYPLTSLAYPLTLLCAEFILGESVDRQVWMGAIMITLGAAIMGFSQKRSQVSGDLTPGLED